jgi:hypothetical protein
VSNFIDFIGVESELTHKREIVPPVLFYKCANIQKNIWVGKYLFEGSKPSCTTQFPDMENFSRFSLTISYI